MVRDRERFMNGKTILNDKVNLRCVSPPNAMGGDGLAENKGRCARDVNGVPKDVYGNVSVR